MKEDQKSTICSKHRYIWDAYKILNGKDEGKRSFGKPRFRCEGALLKWILLKECGRLCIAFNCLRLGSSGRPFKFTCMLRVYPSLSLSQRKLPTQCVTSPSRTKIAIQFYYWGYVEPSHQAVVLGHEADFSLNYFIPSKLKNCINITKYCPYHWLLTDE